MKHFSESEWADFARGVAPSAQTATMQKHLDDHCTECTAMVGIWKAVGDFARQEQSYKPPDAAVRVALSYMFPFKLAARQHKMLRLGRLTFDSFEQPTHAGVRSAGMSSRHVMYKHGDIYVDVRLEPRDNAALVDFTGQVLDASEPDRTLAGVPVSLLNPTEAVFETTTNEMGEFHFSARDEQQFMLLIGTREGAFLVLLPEVKILDG